MGKKAVHASHKDRYTNLRRLEELSDPLEVEVDLNLPHAHGVSDPFRHVERDEDRLGEGHLDAGDFATSGCDSRELARRVESLVRQIV